MSLYKVIVGPTGQLQFVPSNTVLAFKEGVESVSNLPLTGNNAGDARITHDTQHLYVWDGVSWIDQGDIFDLDWDAIIGRPNSLVADIDDAVSKKHTQGTDQGLDTGGANASTASDVKDAVNKKHDVFDANNIIATQVFGG